MNKIIKAANAEWTARAIEKCAEKADELAAKGICYICMKYFKDCKCNNRNCKEKS